MNSNYIPDDTIRNGDRRYDNPLTFLDVEELSKDDADDDGNERIECNDFVTAIDLMKDEVDVLNADALRCNIIKQLPITNAIFRSIVVSQEYYTNTTNTITTINYYYYHYYKNYNKLL